MFSKGFFNPENRYVYQIMWKNIVERGRPQMTIWRMRIACCVPKATHTNSQYVILNSFLLKEIVAIRRLNVTVYLYCLYLFTLLFFCQRRLQNLLQSVLRILFGLYYLCRFIHLDNSCCFTDALCLSLQSLETNVPSFLCYIS